MAPITVAHLIPTLSSGGAERQLVNLVCGTSSEAVRHIVCTINESGFFAPQVMRAGNEVVDFEIGQKHPFLRAAIAFNRILRLRKPDIVHSWLYDANVAARLARLMYRKVPVVTSLQLADYDPEAARIGGWNPHKIRILRLIDKFTARLTDPFFVPCSEFVKRSYQEHFDLPLGRAEAIPNAFDSETLKASGRPHSEILEEIGVLDNSFLFLNVGRLDPQKNHKTIIQAFRVVADSVPDVYLLFAGVGSIEKELKAQVARENLSGRVKFLGRRSDIGDLLEIADVFVFPSFFEGLPVALIEAMSKGVPCIASDLDVFREVITDNTNGILVNPASAEQLANKMLQLQADNELRKRLGNAAHEHVRARFSVEATVGRWEVLYRKLLENRGDRKDS